jgi:class 3 adenylate cyclase/tetratricopeptide (TPR) repeat protein
MRCSRCRAENPAGMRFCGQCAAPLGAACPSCGAANPPENRFCGSCATPLDGYRSPGFAEPALLAPGLAAAPAHVGEMKQVSVLFCDIVGSTALTERLGAEAMRDLVNRFLEVSITEVRRYDGTVPQFAGDGFMAIFGAPLTHEDHVRRALLAALGIQRALGGGGEAADRLRLDLPVRIGIHTGAVVFGPISDRLPMDPTVIGDAANVASRLQTAAEPGTVLISEATRLLAQGYARVDPVGPLSLKGKDEPIVAHRLLGVSHRRSPLDEVASVRPTAFVGRDSELANLNDLLRRIEAGYGRAVGIVGDPGIGKSRLVAEFHRQLADRRLTWIEGRCFSYGTAIPYALLLDLLRSNCGIFETDTPEAITEKVRSGLRQVAMDPERDGPVLLDLLDVKGVVGVPILSNPEAVKGRVFEILRRISIKASLQRPLVLVLEDLHWVDKVSEEFLGFLAENVSEAAILMLATYRPGYQPPWIGKSYSGQTPLPPLSVDDSLHMVRSVLRAERLIELVTQEIVAKAEGNPFFLEQLALHAGEASNLRSDLRVPNTIHDVVMARIDRLPDDAKRLLQTASVIGREFPLRLLSAVWRGPGPVEDQIRELSQLEFIYERVESEGSVYVFRHALTQETAYGSLLERHRRVYHGAIGHALEEFYSGRAHEVAELLALHFGRSDEAEKSVDYAILAAEKSQRRWANSEALTYFNDALRRLEALPDTEPNRLRRIDAVIKQGDGKFALGQHAEHIGALDQIYSLVDQIGDPHRRATWHYWRGFAHMLTGGHPDVAIDHCNEASSLAAAAGLDEIKAHLESCLAQAYLIAGRLREAIDSGERALATFEAAGNLWWAVRTISHLSPTAIALGEWDKSLSCCRRAIEYGATLNDPRLRVIGLWRMGATYIQQGDPERGVQCCNEALALGPLPYDAPMAKGARGYGEIKAGRVEAGIADLSEAVAWLENSRLRYTPRRFALWLAEGHLQRGDRVAARPLIEDVLESSRTTGYRHFEGAACWLMAECLAPESSALAEPYVDTAMEILGRIGARNDLARAMVTRAALRQAAGEVSSARQLLDQAHAIFHALGTLDEPARVETARAALDRGAPIGLSVAGS